jgi:hypothetical protein
MAGGQLNSVTTFGNLLRYERTAENERLVVLLNFGQNPTQTETEAGTILAGPILVVIRSRPAI